MNVYDTANRLAQEIKTSEEYNNFKVAKQAINLNSELKAQIDEFEKARYEVQITAMQTGKNDEEGFKKVQEMYAKLMENNDAKKFFEAETKFNILFADVNKIIGESVRDLMQ
ncbi:MAG: YlbF family regulator [Clostridia bacterium]|nr:YlbF family regulator [Clostridia bacterium]